MSVYYCITLHLTLDRENNSVNCIDVRPGLIIAPFGKHYILSSEDETLSIILRTPMICHTSRSVNSRSSCGLPFFGRFLSDTSTSTTEETNTFGVQGPVIYAMGSVDLCV